MSHASRDKPWRNGGPDFGFQNPNYPYVDAIGASNTEPMKIGEGVFEPAPFVHYSNMVVQECSDAVNAKVVQLFEGLGIEVLPKHKRDLDNTIAKIMSSNSRHIDEVFGVLESVGAVSREKDDE